MKKSTCKNTSEEANLPITRKPSKHRASYDHEEETEYRIEWKTVKDGKPCKYCKRCSVELRPSRIKTNQPVVMKQRDKATR